jgi:hypothetical protein
MSSEAVSTPGGEQTDQQRVRRIARGADRAEDIRPVINCNFYPPMLIRYIKFFNFNPLFSKYQILFASSTEQRAHPTTLPALLSVPLWSADALIRPSQSSLSAPQTLAQHLWVVQTLHRHVLQAEKSLLFRRLEYCLQIGWPTHATMQRRAHLRLKFVLLAISKG